MAGRPRKYETPEELEDAIEEYFKSTAPSEDEDAPKKKATITGLIFYLGFESRQSFYDYEKNGEFSYAIKRAHLRIENSYEEKLSENNVAGAIFALKNLGWKDKTETEHSGGIDLGKKPTWFDNGETT